MGSYWSSDATSKDDSKLSTCEHPTCERDFEETRTRTRYCSAKCMTSHFEQLMKDVGMLRALDRNRSASDHV